MSSTVKGDNRNLYLHLAPEAKTTPKKHLTGCWQTANGQRILKIRVIFSPDKFQAFSPDKFQAS